MPTARTRPRRSRLGLLLFVAVLAFVAWRLATWVTSHGVPTGPVPGSELAFRPLPYVMYGLKPEHTRGGELVRTSNALGFRGPEVAVPKPEGVYRIVCLGGSTTYSDSVDDDETYPRHLQEELAQRRPDLHVEVVNAGVPSYTTAESLCNLAFRCLDLEPDAVVVYHAVNDVRVREYPDFRPDYSHYRRIWDGSTAALADDPAGRYGIDRLIQLPVPADADVMAALHASGSATFRRNLLSLVGIARVHGILPVLVTFAANPHTTPADLMAGVSEHNQVIRALCASQDIACIDLDASFPREDRLYADPVHLKPEGTRLKAAQIAEGLVKYLP